MVSYKNVLQVWIWDTLSWYIPSKNGIIITIINRFLETDAQFLFSGTASPYMQTLYVSTFGCL